MILWKLEKQMKPENQMKDQEMDHSINQNNQFQEGTYEKVLVMLRINHDKNQAAKKAKKPSSKKA